MYTAQFPIWIGLRRSAFLKYGLLTLFAVEGMSAVFLNWPLGWKVAWYCFGVMSLGYAWLQSNWRLPAALILQEKGMADLLMPNQAQGLPVRCVGIQFVHSWLVVIEFVATDGSHDVQRKRPFDVFCFLRSTQKLAIFFDQTSPEAFRRLRLWAKWEATASHRVD